jgi:hypothetical protein
MPLRFGFRRADPLPAGQTGMAQMAGDKAKVALAGTTTHRLDERKACDD